MPEEPKQYDFSMFDEEVKKQEPVKQEYDFSMFDSSEEGENVNFTNASSEPSEGATREQSQGGTPSPIVEQELPVGVINKNKVLPYDKNVDKTTVGTPSPPKTISFADFEVENPIDTTVDVSTIDISKYNKQAKSSTPIGGIKGAAIGSNVGIVEGNKTLSPIVEQELPVGIINKNKVLPYKNKVDKTKVGTPNPSLLGSVRGAAIGSKAGIVEGNKTTVGTPSPYDIRKNSVKLEGQESPSTVLMESGGYDGKEYAYPTLFPKDPNKQTSDPKDWIRLEGGEAFDEAKKRKEVWEFDSQEEADKFARGSWKKEYKPRISETNFSKMEEIPSNKEYKPRTSEINFPKMEEIPSMKDGITQNVRDVFTPANTTTTKPIIKEEKIKKIAEVAKNIDNEEDYSMFTESLSYIDGLLNSTIAKGKKFKVAIEKISDMVLEKDFIKNIPAYANRFLTMSGYLDQEVNADNIPKFIDSDTSTTPKVDGQLIETTVADTITTDTYIGQYSTDSHWKSIVQTDAKGIERKLINYRNEFDGGNGHTYATIPANNNENAPTSLQGVEGVAHFFIMDNRPKWVKDIWESTNEDLKKESDWFKNSSISNLRKLKDDQYVPVFKKLDGNRLRVKYKQKKNITDEDYVTQDLVQYNYGDIDWDKKPIANTKQFGDDIPVVQTKKGKPIDSLPALEGYMDGKYVEGKKLYSRFSGSTVVFLFESNGRTVADDYSGSINNIQLEAKRLSEKYNVPIDDITLGLYDAGSYSAKPAKDSNGDLNRPQWSGYNTKGESGSGIGIISK